MRYIRTCVVYAALTANMAVEFRELLYFAYSGTSLLELILRILLYLYSIERAKNVFFIKNTGLPLIFFLAMYDSSRPHVSKHLGIHCGRRSDDR